MTKHTKAIGFMPMIITATTALLTTKVTAQSSINMVWYSTALLIHGVHEWDILWWGLLGLVNLLICNTVPYIHLTLCNDVSVYLSDIDAVFEHNNEESTLIAWGSHVRSLHYTLMSLQIVRCTGWIKKWYIHK